ncbi:MAG TPA: TlpA disulfide reductase family protein [Burkholderiaceae bacterium]
MNPHHRVKALRLMLGAILFAFGLPALAVEQGAEAPQFDVAGQTANVKLSEYHGKLIYLDFWASWCGPCKKSFPWMNDMQKRYGDQGLQVVAVNLDAKRTDALEFLSIVSAGFKIGFDPGGAVARSYGVKGMPSSVLIAPDGRVIAMHEGFNEADRAELENRIRGNLKLVKQ